MKSLIKKAGLAFIFLQVLFLNQAYADALKGFEYFAIGFLILITLPIIAALLFLIYSLKKLIRALIGVSIIWFLTLFLVTQFFTNFGGGIWLYMLPKTIILGITIYLYIREKYYPKEN